MIANEDCKITRQRKAIKMFGVFENELFEDRFECYVILFVYEDNGRSWGWDKGCGCNWFEFILEFIFYIFQRFRW